jgi:hypothetical protein
MKILFSALHFAYFRNFESVIRELAQRGHHVHLTGDEPERFGGKELTERLAAEYPNVSAELLPQLDQEPWFMAAQSLRVSLDYVRVLEPQFASKLRIRQRDKTARIVRWATEVPIVGRLLTRAALTGVERALPVSELLVDYLRRLAPDVVVLASLTYSRSQQLDLLKAARTLGIPTAAAIMSWDHLSSKALLHVVPDLVLVWNDVQRREAVEMHGIPPDRVVITGAQCYDEWFTRVPARTREQFCRDMGLRADRPFALWVHSALSPTPQPPEPVLVERWIEMLRQNCDPALRELGVLVRPHPERLKEWADIDLGRFDNVAFKGRNPIDRPSKDDYFDSLYYSGAVIGLVTSAFLEAAVVGRPVLTMTLPEYRMHQEEMIHFRYLTEVACELLQVAPDLDTHMRQLAAAISLHGSRDERNVRFLRAFVRPAGLEAPATPVFVDAVERLRDVRPADAARRAPALLVRSVAAVAGSAQRGVGRWLINDRRDDYVDEHKRNFDRVRREKMERKEAHRRMKLRRRAHRERRQRIMLAGSRAKRMLRRTRARSIERARLALKYVRHSVRLGIYYTLVTTRRLTGRMNAPDPVTPNEIRPAAGADD